MMSHRFKVGQSVKLSQASYADARITAASVYQIVRLMPADQTGEPAYRIKGGEMERAVRESDIRSF